jgi:hypothetical protein
MLRPLYQGVKEAPQRLKCDGTRAETRFRLSAQRTSPFKSAGASVQSTTGSRGVRISGSNVGYSMFRGSYPLHSPVSPSLGARGGVVVKALRYKPAGRMFDSRWCRWNSSVT